MAQSATPISGDSWAVNPRTPAEAIAYAEKQVASKNPVWYRRCLAFCGSAYGVPFTGTSYAIDIWSQVPAAMRHTGSAGIPTGALLLYRTGSRAGHIALYGGNGVVYSNDIGGNGKIAKVKFENLINGPWRLTYVGWVPPYFPRNSASKVAGSISQQPVTSPGPGGTDPATGVPATPADGSGDSTGTLSAIGAGLSWLTDAQHWRNLLMILAGVLCILFALARMGAGDAYSTVKGLTNG